MSKVFFYYNIEKDAWSWSVIAKTSNTWGCDRHLFIQKDLLNKIKKSSFSCSQDIFKEYIRKDSQKKYKNIIIKKQKKALEQVWELVEKKYFKELAKVMQKPVFSDKFFCYFTTGFMCPYDEKGRIFTVSMWQSIPEAVTTVCHEIMHLQFLYYYKDFLRNKGLKNIQIEDLKESLTFILNETEFKEIILSEDLGYSKHQNFRKKLKEVWQKDRNFKKLLEAGVLLMKNEKCF